MTFFKPKTKQPAQIVRLLEMLQTTRPAGSQAISDFIARFIAPVCDPLGGFIDGAGNYIVKIGKKPATLFSSHTDTVHSHAGTQKIKISGSFVSLSDKEKFSTCLGADCTTGVWLMLEMIQHNVKGLYIFHDSEEIGGKGSDYIAHETPDILQGIKYAIAFDRKGTTSIITHQYGGRCCSNAFADSLATLLPPAYLIDTTGTFTDTANYMYHIPECTNISVGYFNQHTKQESQCLNHALALRAQMLRFDDSVLVCDRDPADKSADAFLDWSRPYHGGKPYTYGADNSWQSLCNYVQDNPDIIADFLHDSGYDTDYFLNYYRS